MKREAASVLIALIVATWLPVMAQSAEPRAILDLDQILTPSEKQTYTAKSDYRNRAALFRTVLRRLGESLSAETGSKDYPAIDRTLLFLNSVAFHGIRQAGQDHSGKDARSRKVKRLEIELRRLIEALEDLKLRVHFELRLEYEGVRDRLEDYRSAVLALLFESSASHQTDLVMTWQTNRLVSNSLLAVAPTTQRRRRSGDSGIRGDQFTDEEYNKVQDAQKLMDRVKVFIEIAESRLKEIERRREGIEWEGDKENPIEFYTIAQMVHAYNRSIEGIMIFIDEKATRRLAEQKEIKKALTLLNKKIQGFIPQLEPIRQASIDTKDEELFIEIRSAIKNSDAALKGSQMGLGAPANN